MKVFNRTKGRIIVDGQTVRNPLRSWQGKSENTTSRKYSPMTIGQIFESKYNIGPGSDLPSNHPAIKFARGLIQRHPGNNDIRRTVTDYTGLCYVMH